MKLLILVGMVLAGGAQVAVTGPAVEFGLERPAAKVSYKFALRDDGTGTYTATYPATPPATPGGTVSVPLMLHTGTAKKIFEQAGSTVVLHGNCETKAKNIAQTGMKMLGYVDAAGVKSTCTWNYSEKAALTGLQDEFIGMAMTLDVGRRLAQEQRFDRLGMDRETAFLLEQVKAGQARGLENIAPLLQTIADDESLLERVRSRAKVLLEMSKVER